MHEILIEPVEVSHKAYQQIRLVLSGIVFHREENGKYYVKLGMLSYAGRMHNIIKQYPL